MPKKQAKKTAKEIQAITERLHGSAPSNMQRKKEDALKSGKSLSKEEVDSCVERLFQKDPDAKRKELEQKFNQNADKERPDSLGWQKVNKEDLDATTSRLFVADYTNRFAKKDAPVKTSDKEMSKDEYEAMVERLHVKNYNNKNIVKNTEFYDQILNKKKATEKVLSKEEFDEAVARLGKVTREPAGCNKELLGKKAYEEKGIYGTYALIEGGMQKPPVKESRTAV